MLDNQEFGHSAVPLIPRCFYKDHQPAVNLILNQWNINRTHCTWPTREGIATNPKSSKSQPKLAFREAPRLLHMLPPTNIFKYTEISNLNHILHDTQGTKIHQFRVFGAQGMKVSLAAHEKIILFNIQSDGTGVWCWWQNLKHRFHPKSFGINGILNTNFSEARISA